MARDEGPNIRDLAHAKGVTLKILSGEPSLAWDKQDEWQQQANGYRLQIRYKKRAFSFDWWQGTGIKDDPEVGSCLDSLLSDAQAGEESFEDFCGSMGCDTDSRKAEKTWKACRALSKRVKRLLGADYEGFLMAERL